MKNKVSMDKDENLKYIEDAIKLIKTEDKNKYEDEDEDEDENQKNVIISYPNKEDIIIKCNNLKISLLISQKKFTYEIDNHKYNINSKNDYSFSSVVKTIIEKLDRNNTRPICFEGNNIFSSLEYNFSFSELFCKYIEKYKKYINLNFIPFDYFYKNRCLFDVIDDDELKTNPIEKINLIKSKEINNISNSTYYSNVSKGRYIFSKYIKSIFSIIDLYSEKEAEYFAKKVDASNLKIVSCDEEFFINIKNSNLDFYEVVDYIFDIFKNEGFRYIDFDFMNDYFKLIKFSESFKRTNLISYMMKNTNLLFSRFNSFNF